MLVIETFSRLGRSIVIVLEKIILLIKVPISLVGSLWI